MNTAEARVLREVEWKENEAILRVELWRDNGPRTRNRITTANFVAPLQLPPRPGDKPGQPAPGKYKVRVEWTLLLAPYLGAPYTREDPASTEVKKLLDTVLNAGNPARFTID